MNDPKLELFVTDSRKRGVPDAETRKLLSAQGWTDADLDPLFPLLTFRNPVGSKTFSSLTETDVKAPSETLAVKVPQELPKSVPHEEVKKEATPVAIAASPAVSFSPKVTPVSSPVASVLPSVPSSASMPPFVPVRPIEPVAQSTPAQNVTFTRPSETGPIVGTPKVSHKSTASRFVLIALFIFLVGGGSAFAYFQNIWPFSSAPYANDLVLLKGLSRITDINTFQYKLAFAFKGMKREADAVPFSYNKAAVDASTEEARPMYDRDKNRFLLIQQIISDLKYSKHGASSFPATLWAVITSGSNQLKESYKRHKELVDSSFVYSRSADGQRYTLKVTFETKDAIDTIKKRKYDKDSLAISGMTATFDEKNNTSYFYFPGVPSQPPVIEFLKSRDEMLSYLPKQITVSTSLLGSADVSKKEDSGETRSGSVSILGDAEFGDSTYTFGLDVKVAKGAGYIRLNKFPNFPGMAGFFDPTSIKGKWIKIDKDSQGVAQSGVIPVDLKNTEETKLLGEKMAEAYAKLIKIAQEEKLIRVIGSPIKDSVEGVSGYTYTFGFNRENIITVYTRAVKEVTPILDEITKTPAPAEGYEPDLETLEFLQSDLFTSFFDHTEKNSRLLVSFTKDGLPLAVRYHTRMIPLAETVKLSDQQYTLDLSYVFTEINKPIVVEEPKDFITFDEATEKITGQSLNEARAKAKNAAIQANLKQLRVAAELYLDKTGSYGPTFPKATCPMGTEGKSMFHLGETFQSAFKSLRDASPGTSEGICASNGKSYAIVWKLVPVRSATASPNAVVPNAVCVDSGSGFVQGDVESLEDAIIVTPNGKFSCR